SALSAASCLFFCPHFFASCFCAACRLPFPLPSAICPVLLLRFPLHVSVSHFTPPRFGPAHSAVSAPLRFPAHFLAQIFVPLSPPFPPCPPVRMHSNFSSPDLSVYPCKSVSIRG